LISTASCKADDAKRGCNGHAGLLHPANYTVSYVVITADPSIFDDDPFVNAARWNRNGNARPLWRVNMEYLESTVCRSPCLR
jgi:hypothetical protein